MANQAVVYKVTEAQDEIFVKGSGKTPDDRDEYMHLCTKTRTNAQ